MSGAGDGVPDGGFTLIEMLVILAVLTLVSGIVFPAVDRTLRRQAFSASAARVEVALRTARADAIGQGRPVRFVASGDRHGVGWRAASERLPTSSVLTVPDAGITFFGDGGATGGEVALADGDARRRWTIGASTGAIERER